MVISYSILIILVPKVLDKEWVNQLFDFSADSQSWLFFSLTVY